MLDHIKVVAILAMDEHRWIGYQGHLPNRKAPEDMAHFRRSITDKTIVMGALTYHDLRMIYADKYPDIHGHPKAKHNIIVSRRQIPGAVVIQDIHEIASVCTDDELWVIGWSQTFTMFRDVIDEIYITHIHGVYPADTFLPVFESDFVEVKSWSAVKDPCRFVLYRRK